MFDLNFIRENPDLFDAGQKRRGNQAQSPAILALDKQARALTQKLNELQEKRNAASKQIGAAKAKGDEDTFRRLMAEVDAVKKAMPDVESAEKEKREELRTLLSELPNLPYDDVPDGADEAANQEVRQWGEPRQIKNAKEHFDLGESLGQMDFETAAKMSGARFVLLSGDLARLERAIAGFMLDTHTGEFGYREVSPPILVRDNALYGTGQLPKFAEDSFRTTNDHWLIPTAEVTLTNIVSGDMLDEETLPRRFTAHTPCFRSEAGSAGRDTRGMIRLHQFNKVELVSVTTPENSRAEHDRMTECAETILKRLELPFRTMVLCTGDMGFGARKTYDLEVWLPGQGQYREISSCSDCGDFQARRMNARFRVKGEKTIRFPHTLNGSGLAVGRTLVAILENYQQPNGSIAVPSVLQPYMGGLKKIEKSA